MNKEDKDILEIALTRYDQCVSAEADDRKDALDDIKFAHGEQWPVDVKADREAAGQPCLTINRTQRFIKQVVNDIRQVRPAIKTHPVDSAGDPETSEIMTGMIRAIEQSCNAEIAYDWAAESAITSGKGFWRITTEYSDLESFEQDIVIKRIRNRFSVYLDPNAKEPDGSDAKFGFVVKSMLRKDFEAKYPGIKSEWDKCDSGTSMEHWYTSDSVLVAEYWELEEQLATLNQLLDGSVSWGEAPAELIANTRESTRVTLIQRIITGRDILETKKYPFKYIPIIPVLGEERDIEGKTYLQGMVRDMKDAQRMYNYMRSASAERIGLAVKSTWIGPKGAFKSPKWKLAHKKNFPFLEWDTDAVKEAGGIPPVHVPPPEVSSGLVQEQQTAAEELKAMPGIYDAGLGDRSNEVSGVAINARNLRSDIANFHYVDNLSRAQRHSGRVMLDMFPTIYSEERVIRILKPDGDAETVQINAEGIDKKTQKPYHFDLNAGKYDIVVDIGPSFATQRQEAVESMLKMVQAYPAAMPVMGDLLAKNMDWPEAPEIAKRLKLLLPAEIAADENPQIKQIMEQSKQQMAQGQQYISMLEAQIKQLALQLESKDGELSVKEGELARKYEEMYKGFITDMRELELKYQTNVPGAEM